MAIEFQTLNDIVVHCRLTLYKGLVSRNFCTFGLTLPVIFIKNNSHLFIKPNSPSQNTNFEERLYLNNPGCLCNENTQ